jgi:hypothetical protein
MFLFPNLEDQLESGAPRAGILAGEVLGVSSHMYEVLFTTVRVPSDRSSDITHTKRLRVREVVYHDSRIMRPLRLSQDSSA